jgi:hypothetical protein
MATNNLSQRSPGQIIRAQHVNDYFTALGGVFVPRNTSGAPETNNHDLGTNTFKWRDLYVNRNGIFGQDLDVGRDLTVGQDLGVVRDAVITRHLDVGDLLRAIGGDIYFGNVGDAQRLLRSGDNFIFRNSSKVYATFTPNTLNINSTLADTSQSLCNLQLVNTNWGLYRRTSPNEIGLSISGTAFARCNTSGVATFFGPSEVFIAADTGDALRSTGLITRMPIAADDSTSATTPVCILNADGRLRRSTSSERYKKNIKDLDYKRCENIFKMRAVEFESKNEEDNGLYYGLIAEELAEVDKNLVYFDKKDRPDSVAYLSLPALMLPVIQKQRKQIDALEKKVEALEKRLAKVNALEKRLDKLEAK